MRGAIHQLPQYFFMGWCLVKHRGNFIFTLTLEAHLCYIDILHYLVFSATTGCLPITLPRRELRRALKF
jgi:hypothetical protein